MGLKMLKWRSIHDALPDVYENVIVCYRTNVGDEGWNVAEGHCNEDGTWTVLSERDMYDVEVKCVCAWMEFPEPPRVAFLRGSHWVNDTTEEANTTLRGMCPGKENHE